MSETLSAIPWAWVVVGGPVLLGLALAWAMFRNRRPEKKSDPDTPADDPSRGMTGHD